MEAEQHDDKEAPVPHKSGSKKKLIIIIIVLIAVIGGGAGGYMALRGSKKAGEAKDTKEAKEAQKTVLVAIDPFVVNLSEQGRYLKVTMQFEVASATDQPLVTEKMPNLRDAIITLLSSKSSESVAGPEGKLQLKDELLLWSNQAVGKDVFKNLFFTEFVMQ